jgi:hypothetical protein
MNKKELLKSSDSAFASARGRKQLHMMREVINGLLSIDYNYQNGDEVEPNTIVRVGSWLMGSNKKTNEPAEPITGIAEYALPDEIVSFNSPSATASVYSVLDIDIDDDKDGEFMEVRCIIPDTSDDYEYRVLSFDISGDDPVLISDDLLDNRTLTANQWNVIASGSSKVVGGTKVRLVLSSLNTSGDNNVSGRWLWEGNSNSGPSTQSANKRSNNRTLRIHKADLDNQDRTVDLNSVGVNTDIRVADASNPNSYYLFSVNAVPTDSGDYVEYSVSISDIGGSGPSVGEVAIDLDIPIAASTRYHEITNYWSGAQIDYGTASGKLYIDGIDQGVDPNNAYGIDIKFAPIVISDDWEFITKTEDILGL